MFEFITMRKSYKFMLLCGFFLFLLLNLTKGQPKRTNKKTTTTVSNNFNIEISQAVANDSLRLIEIFKDLHANPELGFMEIRTAGIVAKELKGLGYEVKEGIGKTGVAGILKNGQGPIVMYRADMDCNAVKETTGLPYASNKIVKKDDGSSTPVMHACGHDAHTTWLMGVAKIMASMKDKWAGTLIFVAQPAEEAILGAEAMVNDGLYSKYGVPEPDYLFGMHTAPVPVSLVAAAKGVRMAGTDQIDVTFKGIGGHGSTPQLTKDPIIMAAAAIMEYQIIISRAIDPQKAAVLTIGSVQAGNDNNVIPSTALVKINLRWFDEHDRKLMIEGIKQINEGIANAYNLPDSMMPVMKMKGWSYPLDNSDTLTDWVITGIKTFVPENKILKEDRLPAVMGSEDFHHLVIHNQKKKYCYINVGIANPALFQTALKQGKQLPFNAHNGDFQVDTDAIPFGVKIATAGLFEILKHKFIDRNSLH
jgi:amidohydrolase